MSPRSWTPGSAVDAVLATLLVLVARNDCADAEGDQHLQAMHSTWRHSCQSPKVTHHCYCSLGLLHVDFTSIETMMELDHPPNVVNLLVFGNHFTKHVMVYVTPNQTVKTVVKFLWQGYISIFRAPAKLLIDWGAHFESSIIRELCKLIDIWEVRTSPHHAQTNG